MKTRMPGCLCLLLFLAAAVMLKTLLPLFCLCAFLLADGLFLLWGRLCMKRLKVSIIMDESAEQGRELAAEIRIDSRTLCPFPLIAMDVEISNLLTGEIRPLAVRGNIAPRGSIVFRLHISSEHCGRLSLSPGRCRIFGFLGIVALRADIEFEGNSLIMPEIFPIELTVGKAGISDPECDTFSPYKPGNDPSETFAIRDYLPGDALKSIHWKLSGKFDRLVIREASLPVDNNVLLLFEHSIPGGKSVPSFGVFHGLGEIIASLSRIMTENGINHTIGYVQRESGEFDLCGVESHEDFQLLLPELLSRENAAGDSKNTDTVQSYLNAVFENHFANIVYVSSFPSENVNLLPHTCRVTSIICCDDRDIVFPGSGYLTDSLNYRTELCELII